MNLVDRLAEHGIKLRSHQLGDYKLTCPRCSASRKLHNRRDPCLSVTVDHAGGAVWRCHNCGWDGNVPQPKNGAPRMADNPKPHGRRPNAGAEKPAAPEGTLPDNVVAWFAKRRISKATLDRNGIGYVQHFMPAAGKEVSCIAFPYRRRGEVVNVKYRDGQKHFSQVKDAEKILFGLDDIGGQSEIIIVEGECDKLALEEAGICNAASVPDGAPQKVKDDEIDPEQNTKFSYLWNCREEMAAARKIILAVDGDGPGCALAEELARRLGRERCWRVSWPCANDVPCKDANEVLVAHGPDVLREVIAAAQPYPIKSLFDAGTFESEALAVYRDGRKRGCSTGWRSLDALMTVAEGRLTVVTGIPNAGKSEFIDALTVNLARAYGWRFAMCSFENNPGKEHLPKLAEKYLGQPFYEGPRPRMSETDLRAALAWIKELFFFIRADDESPTIEWVIATAKAAVLRHGVRGVVLDPYNEFEHKRPDGMSETEYVSQMLAKVKRFAQAHGVHVWFIAHPAKLRREDGGRIPVPGLYDISGSANWANKADLGVVVHRVTDDHGNDTGEAEIHIVKVRFKEDGRKGRVTLRYDRATGCYAESTPPSRAGAARAYPDD